MLDQFSAFSSRGDLSLQGTRQIRRGFFLAVRGGVSGGVLLKATGYRPVMPLNILQRVR